MVGPHGQESPTVLPVGHFLYRLLYAYAFALSYSAVYAFTDKEKDVWVYATGSAPARTRLYRMGITK